MCNKSLLSKKDISKSVSGEIISNNSPAHKYEQITVFRKNHELSDKKFYKV
jgi:hypothetical protein